MVTEPATNTSKITRGGGRNLSAVGYMAIAVMAASFLPLVVHLSNASVAPFWFNALFRMATAIGCVLFLLIWCRDTLLNVRNRPLISKWIFGWPNNKPLIWATVGAFDFALFALSVKFIDVTVAAILFETGPVFMIILAAFLFRDELRYRKIRSSTVLLILLSMAGFVFAIASQTDELSNLDNVFLVRTVVGVVLVVAATIAAAFNTFGWRWGADLSKALPDGEDGRPVELCCVVIAWCITSLVSALASLTIGLASGEILTANWSSITVGDGISIRTSLIAFAGGISVHTISGIAWRKANFTTDNLGINAFTFGTPILSLTWLFLFSQADVARLDFLIIGTATIIIANLLINFEAEIRWGFKALILALGICGAIVYFRDGAFESLGIDPWNWRDTGYFESITLAATVFILLLAFRVARLVARTREEDNLTFSIYRKLDLLARRGIINSEVCRYILEVDKLTDPAALRAAYSRARRYIADVDPKNLNEADTQLLSETEGSLDSLVRSKQVDIHLGEIFALSIFAAITVGISLLSRPPVAEGWTRLLVDLFAMVMSAVIIFLLVHIRDLQSERDERKLVALEPRAEYRMYGVRFLDTSRRSFDQWLSVVVGGAIVLTYSGLLADKWLG